LALTDAQIESFKRDGSVILEGFVEPDVIDLWREQIWSYFDGSLDAPQTWPDVSVAEGFQIQPPQKEFTRLPQVRAVVDRLGGGLPTADGEFIIKWPQPPGTEWSMPADGHIDGYPPGRWSPLMFGATTYLYDVEPGGGAFVYWPESHRSTHSYFLEHPDQIDGSFREIDEWDWSVLTDRASVPPREFAARAGDVLFWHSFLIHGGSINTRRSPRFGLIARWKYERPEEFKYEVPSNPWKYWSI
jgi:hypothetical protein